MYQDPLILNDGDRPLFQFNLSDGDYIKTLKKVRMFTSDIKHATDRLMVVTASGRCFLSTDVPIEHIDFVEIKRK